MTDAGKLTAVISPSGYIAAGSPATVWVEDANGGEVMAYKECEPVCGYPYTIHSETSTVHTEADKRLDENGVRRSSPWVEEATGCWVADAERVFTEGEPSVSYVVQHVDAKGITSEAWSFPTHAEAFRYRAAIWADQTMFVTRRTETRLTPNVTRHDESTTTPTEGNT